MNDHCDTIESDENDLQTALARFEIPGTGTDVTRAIYGRLDTGGRTAALNIDRNARIFLGKMFSYFFDEWLHRG